MLKKAALAVFGLVLALSFSAPKAQAEVHVGVAIGTPAVYGSVAVLPASHDRYYGSYGYYDNGYYGNGYYGNAPYGYYYNPYTTYSYYDSGNSYAPRYRSHRRDRDDYWRDRHERLHDKLERKHERMHDKLGDKHERWHEEHGYDYDDD